MDSPEATPGDDIMFSMSPAVSPVNASGDSETSSTEDGSSDSDSDTGDDSR